MPVSGRSAFPEWPAKIDLTWAADHPDAGAHKSANNNAWRSADHSDAGADSCT